MKLGIVTFHRALSYGAMLQAYALQQKLFSLDIENEIVDYSCQYMIDHYQKTFRPVKGNPVRGLAYNLITAGGIRRERITRDRFVGRHLKLSTAYTADTIKSAAEHFDAFITGSDQVWSPTCVGFDPIYFLQFAGDEQKYSYAASIAVKALPDALRREYTERLQGFRRLSLREQSGARLVTGLLDREDVQVHIDPTLLLDSRDWDRIAAPDCPHQPYIFLFTVNKPRRLVERALELSRRTGLKILYLNKRRSYRDPAIQYIDPVEADKFVALIRNARYVCTNSFHGTAFSVLYHKQFIVETETETGRNIRSEELLNMLGLEARILADDIFAIDRESDWEEAERRLDAEREKATRYLCGIRDCIMKRR